MLFIGLGLFFLFSFGFFLLLLGRLLLGLFGLVFLGLRGSFSLFGGGISFFLRRLLFSFSWLFEGFFEFLSSHLFSDHSRNELDLLSLVLEVVLILDNNDSVDNHDQDYQEHTGKSGILEGFLFIESLLEEYFR